MARPRTKINLFRSQLEAIQLDAPELLLTSSRTGVPAGASHLLRVMAIRAAMRTPGANVLLLQKNEGDLQRNHVAGPGGILSLVRDMQAHGYVTEGQNEIRFRHRDRSVSVVRWSGCARESEVSKILEHRTDVLLIDQAEDIPESLFSRLREQALGSPIAGRRVVVAVRSASEAGWPARHWSINGDSGRKVVRLDPDYLDPDLIHRPSFPSYREWLEQHFAGKFIWAPHTPAIVNAIDRWIDNEFAHLAIFVPSQHGKCLAVGTPILTTRGWSTMGELKVGDEVYDETGKPTRVTYKSEIKRDRPVWRVETDDGFAVLADADHRWPVSLDRRCGFKAKTTEYLANRERKKAPILPIHGAVAGKMIPLPVDPWLLGLWLGDGTSASGTITCGQRDLKWTATKVASRVAIRVKFRRERAPTIHTFGLWAQLVKAGVLGNKHIPRVYFGASPKQRRELLRGLIDSDGYVAPDGQVEFTTVDPGLARDARELIVGLGIKCQQIEGRSVLKGTDHGPKYRLHFYASGVASLPRKAARLRDHIVKRDRYIVSVRPAGTADVQCIEVASPSHLFLCGEGLLPTHNTEAGPRHAAPYILQRFPSDWAAIISYNAKIANRRSADARGNYLRSGGELEGGRTSVQEWKTLGGGGCWSAGMAAGQTGNPASWVFPDDPDQDWADAVNRLAQDKKRTRYGSVLRARESMFTAELRKQKLCATVTRWDKGDLVGYAMGTSHDALRENPGADEKWGILALSAIYDPQVIDGYRAMYPLFEVLPDFRTEPGAPLWPERRNAEGWRVTFALRGPIIAATECQQDPRGVERGGNFESGWFVRKFRDPAFSGSASNEAVYAACTRAWDLASTEGGGDWTVGAKVGRTAEGGDILVRHVVRAQFAPRGVKQLMAAAMILDGPKVKIRVPIEPATGGEGWADEIVRYLREVAGWVGMAVPEIVCKRPRRAATRDMSAKAARADAFRSRAQPPAPDMEGGVSFVGVSWEPSLAHMVPDWSLCLQAHPELREIAAKATLFSGDWWTFWLQVLQSFTGDEGRVDDDVDATVDGYEEVYQEPPPAAISGTLARPPGW